MRIKEPSRNAGTRAATSYSGTEADSRGRGLVPLVKAPEGGSGIGRRALSLPGSKIAGWSDPCCDPVAFHAAGLAAAGSPRGETFIWVKRILSTAHSINI